MRQQHRSSMTSCAAHRTRKKLYGVTTDSNGSAESTIIVFYFIEVACGLFARWTQHLSDECIKHMIRWDVGLQKNVHLINYSPFLRQRADVYAKI